MSSSLLFNAISLLSSLKEEYLEIVKKSKFVVKLNLNQTQLDELVIMQLLYKNKLTAAISYIKNIISDLSNRNKLINERKNQELQLIDLYSKEGLISNRLTKSIELLRKYKNITINSTTEKSLYQTSINISKSIFQPLKPNEFQQEFLYSYPSEHFEVKDSSLFIGTKKCLEPIITPETTFINKGTSISFRYPEENNDNIFFMYLIFSDKDDHKDKFPSFCNGNRYSDKGIQINSNSTIKVVSCSKDMIDSNVISVNYIIKVGAIDNFSYEESHDKHNNGLQRVGIDIDIDNPISEIRPFDDVNEELSPQGTDGSYFNGSFYKRNSKSVDDDDDGI